MSTTPLRTPGSGRPRHSQAHLGEGTTERGLPHKGPDTRASRAGTPTRAQSVCMSQDSGVSLKDRVRSLTPQGHSAYSLARCLGIPWPISCDSGRRRPPAPSRPRTQGTGNMHQAVGAGVSGPTEGRPQAWCGRQPRSHREPQDGGSGLVTPSQWRCPCPFSARHAAEH